MKGYIREIFSTPLELVTKGQINFGTFDKAFSKINLLEAKKLFGFPIPLFLKKMRLKEWQAFQFWTEDFFILMAVYNPKSISINQLLIFNRKTKQFYKYEKKTAFWKTKISENLINGFSEFVAKNFKLHVFNELEKNRIKIEIDIKKFKTYPDFEADIEIVNPESKNKPIIVSIPFGKNRGMYSHKELSGIQGVIKLGSKIINLKPENSFAIFDDHKGYYPYNMKYDWVTAANYVNDELVGFNLTDNQSVNSEKFNENGLWKGNQLYLLPPVKFIRPNGVNKEWIIRDDRGQVELSFFPVQKNNFRFNLIAVKSDYYGPFGYFKGFIKYSPGKKVIVDDFFGMGEKKFIRS
ncbi:MAG: DUF2804 domain-containing protein [Bacteroidales bacterium]|nr:DUF2804 domain-containing protein [Bacteroidales bacterium]MBN2755644.1 DUF2804 domain-containing protein [Bacteroidales bacterium]